VAHIPTKLHQYLVSSFRYFMRTDAQTDTAKNSTCLQHSWRAGKNSIVVTLMLSPVVLAEQFSYLLVSLYLSVCLCACVRISQLVWRTVGQTDRYISIKWCMLKAAGQTFMKRISPTGFLQCINAVSCVIWPVKTVLEMTCNVSSGPISLYSLTQCAFVCVSAGGDLRQSVV